MDCSTPQASLSITISWSLLKLLSVESVMPSNHLVLCCLLLLLPSVFPSIRVFPVSQFFASGGQSIGVSASASVLPVNIQDWREMSPKVKRKGMGLMYVCDLLKSSLPTYKEETEGGKKDRSYRLWLLPEVMNQDSEGEDIRTDFSWGDGVWAETWRVHWSRPWADLETRAWQPWWKVCPCLVLELTAGWGAGEAGGEAGSHTRAS